MLELNLVPSCPFGIDGLLSDEAMTSALCVLVDLIHLALFYSVLLIVMVRNNTEICTTVKRRKAQKVGEGYLQCLTTKKNKEHVCRSLK